MQGLFCSTVRMGMALRESCNKGQSRIEITYTATDVAGEDEILHGFFPDRAKVDLDRAERALSRVDGLCWHIPICEMLDRFSTAAKRSQLLIV